PHMVHASEKEHILGTSSEARHQQLSRDIAAVIRLAETALVLNEGGPEREMRKLIARNEKLEALNMKLENDVTTYKDKQEIFAQRM
ncbi:hypothetical protein A2U01_0085244, partial [Trifolium medium]|nr:hypothetical protein [Trifolium medium]